MSPDKLLILVDGSSFLFRAYHAMPELTNASGQHTGAIYGITNMMRKLVNECQPVYLAAVFDAKGKTFRHRIYDQYKANRPPMPDDLRSQLDLVQQIIRAMGLPLVSIEGVEADDVIGTLACQATEQGFHTMIVSSDKDLAQLVNSRVEMIDTMKDLRLDPKGVLEKFGVAPERIVDYLALMGDSSDNIPGVPKVGPKTAVKWLNEYGSLDEVITRADEIGGKVGESLRENLELVDLSRELATIKCDVELDMGPEDLRVNEADSDELKSLFSELEFRSWLKQLDGDEDANTGSGDGNGEQNTRSTNYEAILDEESLERWIDQLEQADIIAVDTETSSLDAHQAELVGLSFAVTPGEAAYLPLQHRYAGVPEQLPFEETLSRLRSLLENPQRPKTGQNLKYDLLVLQNHGIDLQGITHDTMLMSYVLEAGNTRHDMDTLALKYLDHETIKFSDVAGSGKSQITFDQVDLEHATRYAAEDADITLRLHHELCPRLERDEKLKALFFDIEMPLMAVIARIESNGVRIDADMLRRQSGEIAQRLAEIEAQAHNVAGEVFNIASPKQIQQILYEKQGIPVLRKTPKGQPSTAENVLQELALEHELPRLILEHRGLAKLKSTYTDKLPQLVNPRTGRIHTSYHQAVAATGRLSSADPNLQNIPVRTAEGRRIREAFVPEAGHVLMSADYSQVELRIMAHLSADEGLIDAFNRGLDVHSATAAEVFGTDANAVDDEQRRRAKAINFGLIYGMSPFGLARQLGIEQKEAKEYIDIYFDRYPGVRQYMDNTRELAREQGYVETLYGRRLNLPEINSRNAARRQYAERTAINAPMQGTAADLIKLAMLAVDRWLAESASGARIILQVHDELVLEVPENALETVTEKTRELMSSVAKLKVPLVVDTGSGSNWKEAH